MKLLSDRAPLALRVSSLIAVLAVTLAVAGIRPPGISKTNLAVAQQPIPVISAVTTAAEPVAAQDASAMEAKYVPAIRYAVLNDRVCNRVGSGAIVFWVTILQRSVPSARSCSGSRELV